MLLVLILLIVFVVWLVGMYNKLIVLKNRVDNSWSQIDVQLQRRYDLIPNLMETVKGYMEHEKGLFESIAQARQNMVSSHSVADKANASAELSTSLTNLFALSENYPELKANQNFMELQRELKGTEDKIAFSRQFYNDSVTRLNSSIEMFPTNIFANAFNITKREYFGLESQAARENVKIQF